MNNTAVVEVIQSEGHRSKTEKPNQKIIQEYARGQIPVNINITPYWSSDMDSAAVCCLAAAEDWLDFHCKHLEQHCNWYAVS